MPSKGAVKITSISGALTVNLTGPSGVTPTVYSDDALTATISLPATVADGATTSFYVASRGKYTLSVKTSGGTEIAGDNNSTRPVDLEGPGQVGAYSYDARTLALISGDTGHSSAGGSGTSRTVQSTAYAATVTAALPSGDLVLNVGALTGNVTLGNPTGTPVDAQRITYRLVQDATGGRTVAVDTQFAYGTDITASLHPTAASSKWAFTVEWNATDSKWRAIGIVRGF